MKHRLPHFLALFGLAATVGLACLLPLAWVFSQVFFFPEALRDLSFGVLRSGALLRTLSYNGAVAVFATLLAMPAILVVGRGRGRFAAVLAFLLPLTLLMPSVCFTYGWLQVFRLLGVHFLPGGPADVLRCVWTLACWLWPVPAVVVGLSLRRGDSRLQQQALLDGAFWRITLRQLAGPLLASTALVALLAMQEFAVYERSGISVIATEIRTVFETGSLSGRDPAAIAGVVAGTGLAPESQAQRAAAAIATGLPLLAVVAVLALLLLFFGQRLAIAESADTDDWPAILNAGWLPRVATLGLLLLTFILPTAAMLASISPQRWAADSNGMSFLPRVWAWASPYVLGSLLYGGAAAGAALALALLACVRPGRGLLPIALASFLMGGELLAIASIRIYNRPAPWPLGEVRVSGHDLFGLIYNNAPVMVLAYLGRFGWLALLAGRGTWSRAFRELRDMAALDGAGPWRTAIRVVVPIAAPGLAAAAVFVMILSITEVSATVLLAPQRPQPLIVALMGWVHMLRYDNMLEGSLLLMGIVFLLGAAGLALAWAGLRLARVLRPAVTAAPILLLALLATGCDDPAKPQEIWCETGPAMGQLVYPRGIAYSAKDDCCFVVDRTARIQRVERDGRVSLEWRMPLSENGKPVGLSVGPDGNVYVADTHYCRIMVYSPAGKYLRQWGSHGRELGQFIFPTDIAFDAAGNIYVSEYGDNDRIQVFDPSAQRVIRVIGRFGQADGEFARPQSIVIDGDLLYVADACNHRIVVFRTDGAFLRNIGRIGSGGGEFRFPYGLDRDSDGNLLVAEFGNNRVQKIDPRTGRSLGTWGAAGRDPGQLAYPWAVAVDRLNRAVIVDSGNNRLQVARF